MRNIAQTHQGPRLCVLQCLTEIQLHNDILLHHHHDYTHRKEKEKIYPGERIGRDSNAVHTCNWEFLAVWEPCQEEIKEGNNSGSRARPLYPLRHHSRRLVASFPILGDEENMST